MTLLAQIFASGGDDPIINTLELQCAAWAEPLLICNGFEDHTLTTEDDRTLLFQAAGIDVALPKKNTQGGQVLSFAIDNVTGEAQQRIDQALDAGERVTLIFRFYLASDKSAPAAPPWRFVVRDGGLEGATAQFQAAFFDMINTAWPRNFYDATRFPGLKYL